jgi:hypothetical protein
MLCHMVSLTSGLLRCSAGCVPVKWVYHVYDPTLHRRFLRVRLLERFFDYIMYIHVPRRLNQMTDTLANQVLDWHVAHT